MKKNLKIATRKSPLAIWQAEHVADCLRKLHPGLDVELVRMSTQGDKILDTPLAKIGGKALFVKELEQGMLSGEADIAVHSMKDVPAELPEGLCLPVIMAREDPFDAFVSNQFAQFDDLPEGARVGTCSLRRQCQILARRPDIQILPLRGNVNSRLEKLDRGDFDAIILAASGLKRLGFHDRIRQVLPADISLPAVGQGALGLEARDGDADVLALIEPLNDATTSARVRAERAYNLRLEGGCQAPIGAFATIDGDTLSLAGFVGEVNGSKIIKHSIQGAIIDAEKLGSELAERVLADGAKDILERLYADTEQ